MIVINLIFLVTSVPSCVFKLFLKKYYNLRNLSHYIEWAFLNFLFLGVLTIFMCKTIARKNKTPLLERG